MGMVFEDARSKISVINVFPFNSEKKRGGVAVLVVLSLFQSFIFYFNK